MTPAELRAAGRLGGHALAGMVSRAEQVHRAVAGRAFAPRFGPAARPARQAAGGNLALAAVAALNALAGDKFGPELAPLAIQLAVRAGDRDVALATEELAAAFPRRTGRLAVFVHGLAETDLSWHRQAAGHLPYGPRLRADFGYTPVYLRYNTSRHICDNGRDLAGLLDRLLASWPGPVSDLILVGHSMGALVIRGACHYATQAAASWPQQVRRVFYLGSPHLGAPFARAAGLAGVAGCDQHGCLRDHRGDLPLLSGAEHYAISATIAADPGARAGVLASGPLARPASAHGRRGGRQRRPFHRRRSSGGMHHFDLLNHPAVWATMRDILDRSAVSRARPPVPVVRGGG